MCDHPLEVFHIDVLPEKGPRLVMANSRGIDQELENSQMFMAVPPFPTLFFFKET